MAEPAIHMQGDQYRVDTEVFSGPLDLLLYLIRREEVDIYDIPIARITNQYLRYVEMMQTLNLEVAGEFILVAATLIRIKTRLLLPQDDEDGEDTDPREELIMALVEYRKYKEAGEILRDRALIEERNYVPPSAVEKIDGRVDLEPATSLYDLVIAFKEVISTRRDELTHNVDTEEVAIEDRMVVILRLLKNRDYAAFAELFADIPRRVAAVVTFLAMLELARARRIRLYQAIPFSELRVYRGEFFDAPRRDIDLVNHDNTTEQVVES
ncbi:MAG: segregation/condensation protein A [candidate division Zixibacteria bacterium]|nr:segregation/condensation protein A [candidate division Zixibacteria bacterium]